MDAVDCAAWNLLEAEVLAHDLLLGGIDADAREIYMTVAEFIRQDTENL